MSAALDLEKLVDKKELSAMTGLSVRTIDTAKEREGLPFHKIGRIVRFYPSEVIEWIAKKKNVKVRGGK